MTRGLNIATANGVHCFQGAGNEGHDANPMTGRLLAPADAFDVITCGAVDRNGVIAPFSSDGPTADGRLKPEVLARGVATATVSAFSDTALSAQSGTSLSTPLVAGAAACLVQAAPGWSVARMREAIFLTAGDYRVNHQPDPLFVRGYGIIDAVGALDTACFADCDSGTGPGMLDIFDFLCFQNRFATGEPYACDCDTGTGVGLCDVFDFLCFQNAYAGGCP
jgi:serine protease AprX